MKSEYQGWEKDREMRDSSFLPHMRAEIANLSDACEPGSEINVLDIGCGIDASFLQNIHEDNTINTILNQKGSKLNLYSISADSKPKPEYLNHYSQFLTVTNGLSFIPEDIQFDIIYSSWCINYLGPNTFERLVRDSIERIKDNRHIYLHPYQPVENSSAFPKALLEPSKDFYSIVSFYVDKDKATPEEINEKKSELLKWFNILHIKEDMGEDYRIFQESTDATEMENIFVKYIVENELIEDLRIETTMDYAIKIFELKEKKLAKIVRENPGIDIDITSWGYLDTLILKKLSTL